MADERNDREKQIHPTDLEHRKGFGIEVIIII